MNPFYELNRYFQDKDYNVLVFDIETVPDQQLVNKFYTQEEIEERNDPYKVSLGMHKIVAVSYCHVYFNQGKFIINEPKAYINLNDEKDILLHMYDVFKDFNKFVTFNGTAYDIPVIEKRCLIHGLQSNDNQIKSNLRELYRIIQNLKTNKESRKHLDLFKVFDLKWQKGGLSFLLHFIGLEKYESMKGSNVITLVNESNTEKLEAYARNDAYIEAKLLVELINFLRSK